MTDAEFGSTVMIASVACGTQIRNVDAVAYDGKLWLVPMWIDRDDSEWSRPLRMIRIDNHRHQKPAGQWDLLVSKPVPASLLDDPKALDARYEVLELPPVLFPRQRGTSA